MNAVRRAKPKPAGTSIKDRSKFNTETFEALADDLRTGRIPLPRVTVSDNMVTGLRAIIRNTGLISFHVGYDIDGSRPYLKIGDSPKMSVADAREIAKTVRSLAELGIDPQEGLHERLVRDLKEKGSKWRP